MSPLVLVLVGTDHHPFDRMVTWVDTVAAAHPEAQFLVQHGASRRPSVADGQPFLAHAHMLDLLAAACGVVCHGGPGTIMDARAAGHVPICLAREPRRGEHVDGHQQRFVALVGSAGLVRAVTTAAALRAAVEDLLGKDTPGCRARAAEDPVTVRARALLAGELDGLLHPPPRAGGPAPVIPLRSRGRRRTAPTRGGTP